MRHGLVVAAAHAQFERPAGRVRRQLCMPTPLGIGDDVGCAVVELHLHVGSRPAPAPYAHRLVALQHGAVAENRRQLDARLRDQRRGQQQGDEAANGK